MMFIPFVITPAITIFVAWLFTVPIPFAGRLYMSIPWTTPPIISGFILGGWRMALLQVVIMAMSFIVYFPFFKKQDAINLKNEQESQAA